MDRKNKIWNKRNVAAANVNGCLLFIINQGRCFGNRLIVRFKENVKGSLTWSRLRLFNERASDVWIPTVSRLAVANRLVRDHSAHSTCSTRSRAGITTLLLDTSQVGWTVSIDQAFGSTVGRCSYVSFLASTGCNIVLGPAVGEGTTGWWQAWVTWLLNNGLNGGLGCRNDQTWLY